MDQRIVQEYSAELKKHLGSPEFEAVLLKLKADPGVRQDEAVAIASELLEAKIAASTARGTALSRIVKLNNSVVTFKLKQKAVGGRSAA